MAEMADLCLDSSIIEDCASGVNQDDKLKAKTRTARRKIESSVETFPLGLNSSNVIAEFEPQMEQAVQNPVTMEAGGDETKVTTAFGEEKDNVVTQYDLQPSPGVAVEDLSGIKDFLSKPYLLSTITWSPSDNINQQIYTTSIQAALEGNTLWYAKMQGFAMYRGTAVVTVRLNANPFQAGRLILQFIPNYVQRLATSSAVNRLTRTLTSRTQSPNLEIPIDVGSAVMRIPYIAPTNYALMKTNLVDLTYNYDWGSIFLAVQSVLRTGATALASTVDVSIYLHFEDMEFVGPMIPQMAGKIKRSRKLTTSLEKEKFSEGAPISSGLSLVAKAADTLGQIPMLGPVLEPVSWIARTAAGLASVFGFSKPQTEDPSTNVSRMINKYSANATGTDPSATCALIHDAAVQLDSDTSLTGHDEMSFDFLKRVSAWIATATWVTTTATNDVIYTKSISPANLYFAATQSAGGKVATFRTGPPIYYLSNFFGYWRGSIKIRIKIVKTMFHTGRIQITFTPGTSAVTTPGLNNSAFSLREILDISTGDDIELVLPWFIPTNYLPMDEVSGSFEIRVLNELRAPETCSNSIDLLVFFSGGDDFELQCPGNGINADRTPNIPFFPQANFIENDGIGNSKIESLTSGPSSESVSEHFLSVKQLVSRYFMTAVAGIASEQCTMNPFTMSVTTMDTGTGALVNAQFGRDMLSAVGAMYGFHKGSIRMMLRFGGNALSTTAVVNPNGLGAGLAPLRIIALPESTNSGEAYTGVVTYPAAACVNGVFVTDNLGLMNVRVPYTSFCRTTMFVNTIGLTIDEASAPRATLSVNSNTNGFANRLGVFRSCGDDFQFSYFLGAPPLLVSYV
jgi:hypothetical protein